jgi:hypothetical protein
VTAHWLHQLDVADVFHDEDKPFLLRRDVMVARIKAAPFYDEDDMELERIVEDLAYAETPDEWDGPWDEFYDWADDSRVWIKTRAVAS